MKQADLAKNLNTLLICYLTSFLFPVSLAEAQVDQPLEGPGGCSVSGQVR